MKRPCIHTTMFVCGMLALYAHTEAFEPLFYARIDYDVGYIPQSVYSADVDGDGDFDLAVANSGSDNVSILLNNSNGTFEAAVNYGAC